MISIESPDEGAAVNDVNEDTPTIDPTVGRAMIEGNNSDSGLGELPHSRNSRP